MIVLKHFDHLGMLQHLAHIITMTPAVPVPLRMAPLKSGTLKVEDPSPPPQVVPIALNKAEYVDLDTAAPLHARNPVGVEE